MNKNEPKKSGNPWQVSGHLPLNHLTKVVGVATPSQVASTGSGHPGLQDMGASQNSSPPPPPPPCRFAFWLPLKTIQQGEACCEKDLHIKNKKITNHYPSPLLFLSTGEQNSPYRRSLNKPGDPGFERNCNCGTSFMHYHFLALAPFLSKQKTATTLEASLRIAKLGSSQGHCFSVVQ